MARKTATIFLVLIFVLTSFAGCSGNGNVAETTANQQAATTVTNEGATQAESQVKEASGAKGNLEIAYVLFQSAARAEAVTNEAFKKNIKEKGYNWIVTDMDSKSSTDTLAKNIEDAVQKKVDAIVIGYGDLRACKAALDTANSAKIPVFSIDCGWTDGVVVDITSNNYVMSGKVSSYMIDRLAGKGNIVVFGLDPIQACRKRKDALDAALKEAPGIKVLSEHNININNFYEDTQKTMEDYLQKYGKEIDAVWAPFDEAGMACSDAILAAGMTKADIFVTGFDGHDMAIQRMKDSKDEPLVATVGQGFQGYAEKMLELIQKIVVEKKPVQEVTPSSTIYLETPLITEFNLPAEGVLPYLAPDFYSGK